MTVLRAGDWSKVFSDGIMRLELIRMRVSWSTYSRLAVLLRFLWEHWWELETADSHKSCWQTGQERRVWMFALNSKWHLMGGPEIPLLRCWATRVLMRPRISVFGGPLVVWRVWFLKFQISHAVFHSFIISADIHLTPVILAPKYIR